MKILHVTHLLGIGGLERVLFILIRAQMDAGHDVALLVYGDDQTWVPHFRQNGIKVLNDYRKTEGYDRALLKHVNKTARDFDVVHTHDLNPAMYVAPLSLARRLRLNNFPRWIHTAHGMDHLNQRPITRWYERFCGNLAQAVVGVAPHICETYKKNLGVPAKRVHQIDNGIPLPRPSLWDREEKRRQLKERFSIETTGPVWVCVSRVVPLKDQELLLKAAQTRSEMTLLLVGPSGDDVYWNKLKGMCPPNAHMLGGQGGIDEILAMSDYFVSASHHEGIPVAVLEAGAMLLPCLLSDIPGHQVLQKGLENPVARFFPNGDLKALLNGMRETEEQASPMMIKTLRHAVESRFSDKKMSQSYLNVYQGHDA